MMKKLLLLFVSMLAIGTVSSYGQACTPDPNCTSSGGRICPDTITNLPHAQVGIAYSTTITVVVPTDTMVTNPIPLTATIGDYTLDSVVGLPPGFTFQCNPANCVFPGGSTGCLVLESANPVAAGTFPLVVHVTANITAPLPGSQQAEITGYKVVIDNTVGVEVVNENVFALAQNVPNPAFNVTNIRFTSPVNERIELNIYNTMGQIVYHQDIDAERGLNEIPVSVAELADGMYIYTVSNGKQLLNQRMIVAKK